MKEKGAPSLALCAVALYLSVPPSLAADPLPAAASELKRDYGVSTESAAATRDAAAVLSQGGSAADAAIVAALVAGITSPTSSGIGGGGFLVGWDQKTEQPYVLDFRETAPRGLLSEPFEHRPLAPEQVGHLVGVPGEVKGLFALHQRAGKTPWSELVLKAKRHATEGYFVGPHLAAMLQASHGKLNVQPGFAALFYPQGKPALVGTRLTQPALGRTLTRIAQEGPAAFYSGSVAQDIVQTARAHASPLTAQDLADYQVLERAPLISEFEGARVITMPAPSAGGLLLSQVLRLFSAEELRQLKHGSPAYQHLLAEAMRAALADRMRYLGDPAFEAVSLEKLLAAPRLAQRRATFSLDRTHALPRFGLEEHGTHAIVVSDRAGNVISLTTTVNRLFGSKLYAEASGIILNDELDDFTSQAEMAAFGLTQSPNRPRPGARPVSSMTPTIVIEHGQAKFALGGSGGMTIATNATQVLLGAWVFDQAAARAVSAPRFYIPTSQSSLLLDPGASKDHIQNLEERGEVVGTMPFLGTAIQLLKFKQGHIDAAADPRKHGLARSGR
jgi:gamma-glutamyltranspeptidase / glutathione hydrolase